MASNNWEQYKATILNLYCCEDMPLDEVILYMREKHNFDRSKRSYENQLKKHWRVRKNMRKEDWQCLAHQIEKRQGKPTAITHCGAVLSQGKLHRELQRYTSIPTTEQFGRKVLSPEMPEDVIVRIQTPPIIGLDDSWPTSLPWFWFKNNVLPKTIHYCSLQTQSLSTSKNSSCSPDFLRDFFDTPFQNGKFGMRLHSYIAWINPLELCQAVIRLSNIFPDDSTDRQEKEKVLARNEFPLCLVAEMLKIFFFRLANKMDNSNRGQDQVLYNRFILHFVEVIERNNPEIALALFSDTSATALAIKESIYGSAIRGGNHDLVRLLLQPKSGVNPNLLVEPKRGFEPYYAFKRGKIDLEWAMSLETATGLQVAAATLDTRLGEILLSAGAAINEYDCLLELAACESEFATCASELSDNDEDVIDFLRLLIDHGATVDTFTKSCECGPRVSVVFALAISSKNDRLARFLIEKGALASLSKRFEIGPCHCSFPYWHEANLMHLELTYTPLQLAIIVGNREMIEQLLQPIFSRPTNASPESIKKLLLLSCLVGDTATALRLLKLEDIHVDQDMEWPNSATPLILSAWNPDTTIARALLDLGANVGPKVGSNIRRSSTIYPIHAAALYGNANLVRLLADRDVDFDVHFEWNVRTTYCYISSPGPCPLAFALRSQHTETIQLLLSLLTLPGVNLEDHIFISALSSEGISKLSGLQTAVKLGNKGIISHYLSSGDLYCSSALFLATKIAVKSKDYSILNLLIKHRPTRQIDRFEASCLVLSIAESHLDLIYLFLSHPFLPSTAMSYYNDLKLLETTSEGQQRDGPTPLSAAFFFGDILIVKAMIRRGFIPHPNDAVALFEGTIENHEILYAIRMEMLDKFPLAGMDLSCRAAVLGQAIRSGDVKKVCQSMTLLQSLNIGIPGRLWSQKSPLSLAVTIGHIELVTILLDAGADPYDPVSQHLHQRHWRGQHMRGT
ncbi:hypothetical protein RRF57_005945 [Xylaria bambusicola]|uniref:Clr5 domain-containing protein n=1 Tax=Xylaria bambusicola TaxID=326684 RepID=A0AAN7YY71_9PEZI